MKEINVCGRSYISVFCVQRRVGVCIVFEGKVWISGNCSKVCLSLEVVNLGRLVIVLIYVNQL